MIIRVAGFRDVVDRVADAIREVSSAVIEPRFRSLADGEVEEKSPGELVTVADREAEVALTARLADIAPGVPVVGEEGCATEPARLAWLGADQAWVIDPLDGTSNFVAGSADWAVMVALLSRGTPVLSWIWQPATRRMYTAEQGGGAAGNGVALKVRPAGRPAPELRGAAHTGFMEPAMTETVTRNAGRFGAVTPGRRCAGVEYPAVVEGEQDFSWFWRTLPWDHLPGALLVEEAGGVAARPDGTPFLPYREGSGLLVASDRSTWSLARKLLD